MIFVLMNLESVSSASQLKFERHGMFDNHDLDTG